MDVLLVDEKDKVIGKEKKLKAHERGLLHRAFSVFIFNEKQELLLQKRAAGKYHSSGLWTNTCCSHPMTENLVREAQERLKEEMGFSCSLEEKFSFIYRAHVDNNMIEHEFDHVLFGSYNEKPIPNPAEVSDWRWISIPLLKNKIKMNPEEYTPWLKIIINKLEGYIN